MKDKKNAVGQNKKYGPYFGSKTPDLCIGDECHTSKQHTKANFPKTYNNGKTDDSQKSRTAFCGQTEGCNFKVK